MMTYDEWITYVKWVLSQHTEGAVTSKEAFDAITDKAVDVDRVDGDSWTVA